MENEPKEPESDVPQEAITAAAFTATGAAAGYGVIAASGMSAIGMLGSGAGIGAAAGPVGVVIGAVGGLALYGVYRIFKG